MIDPTAAVASELRRSLSLRVGAAVLGALSALLMTIFAVRIMTNRDAAVFLSILAALFLGAMLGRLGLGANIGRLLPAENDPGARRSLAGIHIKATCLLALLTAPIVSAVATIGLRANHIRWLEITAVTAVLIVAESVRLTVSDIFAAYGRVRLSVAMTHHIRTTFALPVIAIFVTVSGIASLLPILLIYTAVAVFQLAFAFVLGRDLFKLRRTQANAGIGRAIKHGALLVTIDLAGFVALPATIWLASAMFTPLDSARYSLAAALAGQAATLEALACVAVLPGVSRLWAAGEHVAAVRILRAVASIGTLTAAIAFLGVVLFAKPLLEVAYGSTLEGAYLPLLILTAATIGQTTFGVNMTLLIVGGAIREAAITATAAIVAMIPVLFASAYVWGPVGLAVASAVATVSLGIAQWFTAAFAVVARSNVSTRGRVHALCRAPRAQFDLRSAWHTISASQQMGAAS